MEQTPKTSFIPKQAIGVAKTRERRSFNVVTFFAMVVFLAVLTLSIAVFFYKEYATANLDAEKRKLADFKQQFDSNTEETIREIQMLDDRFAIAENLLDTHLSIAQLFSDLEESVQSNAQIVSFMFARRPSGDAEVELGGRGLSFNTVALQERGFANESAFRPGTIVFSGIDTSVEGSAEDPIETIVFEVSADVDSEAIAYRGDIIESTQTPLGTSTESLPGASFGDGSATSTDDTSGIGSDNDNTVDTPQI